MNTVIDGINSWTGRWKETWTTRRELQNRAAPLRTIIILSLGIFKNLFYLADIIGVSAL